MKQHLRSLLLRTRGGGAAPLVLAAVDNMTDAEAGQWFRILQNLQDDAKQDGKRQGAREPWRYM